MIVKHYEVQPNKSQKLSLNTEVMLNNARQAAYAKGQDVEFIIKDRGNAGIVAKVISGDIIAWADIGPRGKVHSSYSNQWGK